LENSLKQYIELYRQYSSLVCDNAPEAMNRLRPDALNALEHATLPTKGSELYTHIDLPKILGEDYGLNLQRLSLDVNPALSFRCDVPNVSTALFYNINDIMQPGATVDEALKGDVENGVLAGSLARIAGEHPLLAEKYLGKLSPMDNPLSALNSLLAQDGFMLYVPAGVKLSRPLQLVNILQNSAPLMAVRRILIVLEDDAEVQLLMCDHTQNRDCKFLNLQEIEIFVGHRSRLAICDLEESTRLTTRLSQLHLQQEADSDVRITAITLCNGITRNNYFTRFCGRNAGLWLGGMAIEDEDRYADTYSLISHDVPECHTQELFKHLAEDRATACFSGLILVQEGATGTEAYQQNRNIAGTPQARIYSKPQLEIYNDDVKCSHGSATGSLDPTQLFYMQTRGLSTETATRLLKQAFMADVVESIQIPGLKERIQMLVEHRFSGDRSACAECKIKG